MTQRIRTILTDLEHVRENLMALSDDIWLSIDHNDTQAMHAGVEFKEKYNAKLSEFDRLAGELSVLVQQFTNVQIVPEPAEMVSLDSNESQRIVRELDRDEPHGLDEDFTFKRPYAFVLGDYACKDIVTWKQMYAVVCRWLAQYNTDTFRTLPTNPDFITRRGNPDFATSRKPLRSAMPLPEGLFAEVNLSANSFRNNMAKLLKTFGLPQTAMRIFLRQDRDAEQ